MADSARDGWIPIDKLKLSPKQFVPPHVLIADACVGKHVQLDVTKEDYPYFNAGPNSRILDAETCTKMKDVEGDMANISVYESSSKPAGFGKIGTIHLQNANIAIPSVYAPT